MTSPRTQARLDVLGSAGRADLLRRFHLYVDDGQDNRRAALSVDEVELLLDIASEPT
jgi:hypothetical protein